MTDTAASQQTHRKETEAILISLIETEGLSQLLRTLQYCLEESAARFFSEKTAPAQAKAAALYKAADTLDAPFETIKYECRL